MEGGRIGIVRWTGEPRFAKGNYVGLELIVGEGKHNGVVKDVRYFRCAPEQGIMIKRHKVLRNLTHEDSFRYPRNAPRSAILRLASVPT